MNNQAGGAGGAGGDGSRNAGDIGSAGNTGSTGDVMDKKRPANGEDGEVLMRLENIRLSYEQGNRHIKVLRGASAVFRRGESVALVGPSGAGKSSLLHIVGLLDRPNEGRVMLEGRNCVRLNDRERTLLRRTAIGFVYQFHQLLPEFSALENVLIPQLIRGVAPEKAKKRAMELLASVGLDERAIHRPAELSGGEQQRVAIARAVANRPQILLADEPTGNLDPKTAGKVFNQLLELVHTTGLCAVMATHNLDLAKSMDRILRLENGLLQEI